MLTATRPSESPFDCPPPRLWHAFLSGNVNDDTLDKLSDHLTTCNACLETLEQAATESGRSWIESSSPFLAEANFAHFERRLENAIVNPPLPTKVGRFEVQGLLGSGGFGQVLLANDSLLKRAVAIKVPSRSAFETEGELSSFLSEARHAASLDHPGIVPIYDVIADDDGRTIIVMKHIRGESLARVMHKGPVERSTAIRWMIQIARAVHFAHERGLVHRDLKPANILIDDNGNAHVTDFGLGLNMQDESSSAMRRGGTPAYMSPEQVCHDTAAIDRRTDVWSLGILLAELVHRQRPFPQQNRATLFAAIADDEPILNGDPDSETLVPLIRRCLTKSPAERLGSAEVLADTLHAWLQRHYPTGMRRWMYGWRRNVAIGTMIAMLSLSVGIGRAIWRTYEWNSAMNSLVESPSGALQRNIDRVLALRPSRASIESYPHSESVNLRIASASLVASTDIRWSEQAIATFAQNVQKSSIDELTDAIRTIQKHTAGFDGAIRARLANDLVEQWQRGERAHDGLRAAATLAGLAEDHSVWTTIHPEVVAQLCALPEREFESWSSLFDSVGAGHLVAGLGEWMISDKRSASEQQNAARGLARWLQDEPEQLCHWIGQADPVELQILAEGLRPKVSQNVATLRARFESATQSERGEPDEGQDGPSDRNVETARYAIALWLMGDHEAVLQGIEHSDDPTLPTEIIHRLSEQKVAPESILEHMRPLQHRDDVTSRSIKFGLLQIFGLMAIEVGHDPSAADLIRSIWRDDPDAGVHSAARWAASRLGIAIESATVGEHGRWRVDQVGESVQDFAILEPCVAWVGMRGTYRPPVLTNPWPWHRRAFSRRIAVATNEVTIEQFRRYNATYRSRELDLDLAAPDAAMMRITPQVAMRFCNAWSEIANLEPCYDVVSQEGEERWQPKPDHWSLSGYRFLTDGEWELACRAGTQTGRYFGNAPEWLTRYGWMNESPNKVVVDGITPSQRTAQFLPNRWGLFDMYGNVKELVDRSVDPTDLQSICIEELAPMSLSHPGAYMIRGISLENPGVTYAHSYCRSNQIHGDVGIGIRLARTLIDEPRDDVRP